MSTNIIDMTEGLLTRMKTDDEVAFALAHELGHIIAAHGRKMVKQSCLFGLQVTSWMLLLPGSLFAIPAVPSCAHSSRDHAQESEKPIT
jgi:Zn-dependent protease with chaperone function